MEQPGDAQGLGQRGGGGEGSHLDVRPTLLANLGDDLALFAQDRADLLRLDQQAQLAGACAARRRPAGSNTAGEQRASCAARRPPAPASSLHTMLSTL